MDGSVKSFRDLLAWQLGMDVAVACYEWTRDFPDRERFGLTSQIQRAASSVSFNIAEGWGLGTTPQFLRHCRQARGSLAELETAIELSMRVLSVKTPEQLLEFRDRCARLLQGLIHSLERKVEEEDRHSNRN